MAATLASGGAGAAGGQTAESLGIWAIQGTGERSPLQGQRVSTDGVVTRINNNGFFLQALSGDGNSATSDGLFVFSAGRRWPAVAVGHRIALTGTVAERSAGRDAQAGAQPRTELTDIADLRLLSRGHALAPTELALPLAGDGGLERYEGMLVQIAGPLTVQHNRRLGRSGQLTLAVGGRLQVPTNLHRPGAAARALADLNARSRIVLDDGSSDQNPNPLPHAMPEGPPRVGDQLDGLTGVLDQSASAGPDDGAPDHAVHPTQPLAFIRANPRPAAPARMPGHVRVASFNLLNYFTAWGDGRGSASGCGGGGPQSGRPSAQNCRGADNAAEFQRQRAKIIAAMAAIRADVFGLMEVQNNGNTALQDLADALNAHLGSTDYAVGGLPQGQGPKRSPSGSPGTGTDVIRLAMLYRPAALSPVGAAISDTHPVHGRPPLAQTFALADSSRITVVVNHFKSKGSCPDVRDKTGPGNTDTGDGQGCWNARRLQQAERLAAWLQQLQGQRSPSGEGAGGGDPQVLIIGDLNAYAQEDPIVALARAGYADQIARFDPLAHSVVFGGASGRLDHALASASLAARVSAARPWSINADEAVVLDYNQEFRAPQRRCGNRKNKPCPADLYAPTPYRASDHDPVIVDVALGARRASATWPAARPPLALALAPTPETRQQP